MAAGSSPRIRPGTRREIGWVNTGMVKIAGFMVGGDPPNVFTTLARHRVLFRRWMGFAGKLTGGGKLPRLDAELMILRVAHLTNSEYEWCSTSRWASSPGSARRRSRA